MTERRYTASEIDQMRQDLVRVEFFNSMLPNGSRTWGLEQERARDARVEDQLRTYIAAGVAPEELRQRATMAEAAYNDQLSRIRNERSQRANPPP
jgi:hypothetical protein